MGQIFSEWEARKEWTKDMLAYTLAYVNPLFWSRSAMSLPVFDPQTHLFGLQARSSDVFSATRPLPAVCPKDLSAAGGGQAETGGLLLFEQRAAGVEPVLLLGVSVLQFLERVPDRQAAELVKYHLGWKHALAQELDGEVFDPTVLVRFRERLVEHGKGGWLLRRCWGG